MTLADGKTCRCPRVAFTHRLSWRVGPRAYESSLSFQTAWTRSSPRCGHLIRRFAGQLSPISYRGSSIAIGSAQARAIGAASRRPTTSPAAFFLTDSGGVRARFDRGVRARRRRRGRVVASGGALTRGRPRGSQRHRYRWQRRDTVVVPGLRNRPENRGHDAADRQLIQQSPEATSLPVWPLGRPRGSYPFDNNRKEVRSPLRLGTRLTQAQIEGGELPGSPHGPEPEFLQHPLPLMREARGITSFDQVALQQHASHRWPNLVFPFLNPFEYSQ